MLKLGLSILVYFEVKKSGVKNWTTSGLLMDYKVVAFRLESGLPVVSRVDYHKCQKHLF